jgi:hypothetical protein
MAPTLEEIFKYMFMSNILVLKNKMINSLKIIMDELFKTIVI